MNQPQIASIVRPPVSVFTKHAAGLQQNEDAVSGGNVFDRVEYPDEGGMYAYYFDHPFPAKGNPFPEVVNGIKTPKKFLKSTALFLRANKFIALLVLLTPWFLIRGVAESFLDCYVNSFIHAILEIYKLEPKRYCKAAQEVQRAGYVVAERFAASMKFPFLSKEKADARRAHWELLLKMCVDLITQIIEWDNAWRYRFQDIAAEIIKKAFSFSPYKEIKRLSTLQIQRERGWHESKNSVKQMATALRVVVFFKPVVAELLIQFIEELDLEKVKLDEADEYFNLIRPDYDIQGWPMEVRLKKYAEAQQKYAQDNPERFARARQNTPSSEQVLETFKTMVKAENGIPLMMFFAIQETGNKVTVKMLETEILKKNSPLRELCAKVLGQLPSPMVNPAPVTAGLGL